MPESSKRRYLRAKRRKIAAMTLSGILVFLGAYKEILIPIVTALIGYFIPSPWQKAQKGIEDVHNKAKGVDEGTGATSDLDKLP